MRSIQSPIDGFASPFGQRRGFSPASLFAGGTEGAWYDPSDLTTLFQDSAGTTPVTATGQPVGKMLDKSGNGNHATQATLSKRPIYTEGSGLAWLAFDGVDDAIVTGDVDFTGTDKVTVFAGLLKDSNPASRGTIVNLKDNGFNKFSLEAPIPGNTNTRWLHAGATSLRSVTVELSLDTRVIYTGLSDLGAPSLSLRTNGVAGTPSTLTTGGGNFAVGPLSIGDYVIPNGRYFDGNLYGLIVAGKTTSVTEITSTEAYMAAKTGVTL